MAIINTKSTAPSLLDKALSAARLAVIHMLIFSFVINILMLALPLYSLQVLDRVISTGSMDTLLWLTVVTVFLLGILGILTIVRSQMLIKLGNWLDAKLASSFFAHTIHGAAQLSQSSGSQSLRDLSTLKNFITGGACSTLLDAPWALIFMVILFFIHPYLGLLALVGGGLLLTVSIMNEYMTQPLVKEAGDYYVKAMYRSENAARNAEAIEGMGMLSAVTQGWESLNAKSNRLQATAGSISAYLGGIAKFIRFVLQIATLGIGAYLVVKENSITTGAMIASSILIGRALSPFESSISSWKATISARAAYDRLKKVMTLSPERVESLHLPDPLGQLTLEDVYYVVPGTNKPIIKHLSFKLAPGEILGVVGPSAAGKSSLTRLLLGIWKVSSGAVRLDGADVYSWKRDEFAHHVGYLPQDAELFEGTVKDNIARLNPQASDEQVVAAAQMAHAHAMILHLPQGYETEIGTSGQVLSAGQRQRIGLARAFFGDPKLVVLDEPNANLDQEGEEALLQTLKAAKEKKITTILVSHRPAIMAAVDTILVLRDGVAAAYGPRDEILARLRGAPALPNQTT